MQGSSSLRDSVDFSAFRHYGIWLVVGAVIGAALQSKVPQDPLLALIGAFLKIPDDPERVVDGD